MAQISGITIETTHNGTPKSITFDYKKYGDSLLRFLKNEGINLPYSPYDEKFVKKIKSQEGCQGIKIKTEDLWK
jgi:hypothetical protein